MMYDTGSFFKDDRKQAEIPLSKHDYESEEGYTYLRECGQTPYIKPQTYEKWKNAASGKISAGEKIWEYDETADTYTCHAGK